MQFNRVKFNASLDATGRIVVGTALTGHRVAPVVLWQHTGQAGFTPGLHNYLLEDGAGSWELGYVGVAADGTSIRVPVEYSGIFANLTVGLVCSMVGSVNSAVAMGVHEEGSEPRATHTSMAIGLYAEVPTDVWDAVAIGKEAWATRHNSVAIGVGSIAYAHGEVVLGAHAYGTRRSLAAYWSGGSSADNGPFVDIGNAPLNFGTWDAILAARKNGIMRVKGTVTAFFTDTAQTAAVSKVFDVEYLLFIDATASTATVIGTPAFTSKFAGGSSPAITLSVQASTGALYLSTTSAADFYALALLELHDFQTGTMPGGIGARGL